MNSKLIPLFAILTIRLMSAANCANFCPSESNYFKGLEEALSTSSIGMVTALGMGTVFLCLATLYALMIVMGRTFHGMNSSPEALAVDEPFETVPDIKPESVSETSSTLSPSPDSGMVAAIAIALSRHRASRKSAVRVESTVDVENPWKMAARLNGLRKR